MPRPGLIVGLGGTGQWALTWLKRDLMLSNKGKMPKNIRLLEIDTATKLEAGASRVSSGGQKEEAAMVGGITLGDGEFVYVGGDSRPIAERVKEGKLEQIGHWYHAEKWLSTQSPSTFILDDGAGRLRQFGRMAIFKDVLGQEASSKIWRAFRSALEGVRQATNEQRRLEIMVVGSFAGGTGSGMFIDAALILRMLAQQMNIHHVLRGFFALPSVFTTAPDAEMKARSFAAWRELNRFMVVDSDFPMPMVEYVKDNPSFRIRPSQRLFDACYLVDGRRKGVPIAEEAKYGVFPMMAETISAYLDEEAGTAYTQWVFTNLSPEYARRPSVPMYSAVGAYTVQVPADFVEQISSHRYAQDILLKLLAPKREPDAQQRLVASGADRHLALAAKDQNKEDEGFSGAMRSRDFFSRQVNYRNRESKPTQFLGRVGALVTEATDQNKRAGIVNALARAGGADMKSTAASQSWVAYFPNLGDDPQFKSVRDAVDSDMRFSISDQYGERKGEKEDERRARFRNIAEDVRKRYGGKTGSGEEILDFYGSSGDNLQKCATAQITLFRQHARLRLTDMLMGRSDDALIAKGGKLGYAWDFFDGVIRDFNTFIALMEDVRKERERLKPELQIAGLSQKAQQFLSVTSNKKIFWIIEHPDVKGAERDYLQAQQRIVQLRREDILHHYVVQTAMDMKAICEQARDVIQRWIWHLSTGDSGSGIAGLWDSVRDSLENLKDAHSYDDRIDQVQMLLGDKPQEVSKADLKKALSQWEWVCDFEGEPARLVLKAEISSDDRSALTQVLDDPVTAHPDMRREAARRNQQSLLSATRKRFMDVAANSTIADEIKRKYEESPEAFASAIANISAEPLFEGDSEATPRKKSNFIRVKTKPNDPFFEGAEGLEGELRKINNLDLSKRDDTYGIQVVQSENPFKLTCVRTDDLYDYNHFAAWGLCEASYGQHMKQNEGEPLDPVLMHNFAAEARAVEIERKFMQESEVYEPLHPRVVMLLEDPDALRQFLYLGMLGLIGETTTGKQFHWQLQWEKRSGIQTIWLTRGWNESIDSTRRSKPDIFNAAHGYVILRRSQEGSRADSIDYEFAQRLIDEKLRAMGQKGELNMLRANLAPDGFVGWLTFLSEDTNVPGRIVRRDYAHLAKVAEMYLQERMDKLLSQQKNGSPSGSVRGPFKVFGVSRQSEDAAEPDQDDMDSDNGAEGEKPNKSEVINRFAKN